MTVAAVEHRDVDVVPGFDGVVDRLVPESLVDS